MAELSEETGRQIGVLINRIGLVEYVLVGDERQLYIPELTDHPLGKKRLRGLRLCHTHLKGETLTEDDLTDLALLRFDLMAAILLTPGKKSFSIQIAYLSADPQSSSPCHIDVPCPFESISYGCARIHFFAGELPGKDHAGGVRGARGR